MRPMRIAALTGGVGGARFLRGLVHHVRQGNPPGRSAEITVIGNTGDDITLAGLRICPDLDTVLYTLGGGVDEHQGWGRAGETHAVREELRALEVGPDWFSLGDRDIATHLARSQWLGQGLSLTEVTERLARRWGLPGLGVRLLPVTDTPIETHVVVAGDDDAPERAMHFQQWWVQHRAALPARRFTVAGLDRATAAPGVLDALRAADVVLLPPSNPVVSIGIILGVPGVRDALRGTRAPVVGVSPIIGGEPVRGHADACLAPLGVEVSAAGVAGLYADFLDGWLVDDVDAAGDGHPSGTRVLARDLHMRDVPSAAGIAGAALDLALALRAEAVR
jgi:LPPG:FO 2-phospho-L-lactate transferase